MTISKNAFLNLTRAFALSLCTALLLSFVSCSDSSTCQDPKVKIVLDANDGSFSETTGKTETTKTLLIKKNQTSKLPTADELNLSCANHEFTGWAKSQQGTVEYNDGDDITSSTDLTLYAQWEAVNSTYTVRHLLQNLADDEYTEDSTEQKSGTSGTQTAAVAKTYEGFTAKSFAQETIQTDGSTVVEIKYDRNNYTVSYSSTYGDKPKAKTVKYEYVLTAADLPVLSDTVLSFNGWRLDSASIEAGYTVKTDITITALWKAPPSVTKENFLAVIPALTENSTIVVTGEVSDSDLTTLKTAIWNSTYNVNLDLSQTTGLTSIPNYTFEDCSKLSGITIPDSVTSIGSAAFHNCTSLSSVNIPDSVTSISNKAFLLCTSLTTITVDSNNTNYSSIDGVLFNNSVTTLIKYPAGKQSAAYTIPDSVTTIGRNAFERCTALSSVTIPVSVTSIGDGTFSSCDSLYSVTIPDSVTSIGDNAFEGCTALYSVNIPDNVTSIGGGAFFGCTSLSSVTIGDSVTSIGVTAFFNCSSLSSVTIPDSVTSIGNQAFCVCTSLSSVTIGNSVTSIGDGAFYSCISLSSVTIGNSVTSIGDKAFYGCSNLTSLTFTDTTTWYRTDSSTNWENKTGGTLTDVSDPATNAASFTAYNSYYWYKLDE